MQGILIALIAPVGSLVLLFFKYPVLLSGESNLTKIQLKTLIFQIISLGLLINVGLFFLFLRFKKESISRGILAASLIVLLAAVIHKFLL
ncbi:hypothetical protein JCM31826_03810 [Thermaurantimonas aggregans]|uniref:Uncharacterized protein n=2 Tax=Thermaurantimonas aggregans TaxID=2173829 RepID=A0A401XIQ7_9FLAO|nr:hypothetical protein [Thermaurantimonas aggregans]GCD76899.1 hypothetical protein JCM31826_03810 [Thermaurantimonas aggregans]